MTIFGEKITINGREYERVIPWPEPVTDGTVRCIVCGQIDEHPYHDNTLCPATMDWADGIEQHDNGKELVNIVKKAIEFHGAGENARLWKALIKDGLKAKMAMTGSEFGDAAPVIAGDNNHKEMTDAGSK